MPYVRKYRKRRRTMKKRLPMKRRRYSRKKKVLRATSYCCKKQLIQHPDINAGTNIQNRGLLFYTLNTLGDDMAEFSEHWNRYRIRKVVTTFECAFNEALTPTFGQIGSTNTDGQYPKIAIVTGINADITPVIDPANPDNPQHTLYAVLAAKTGCRTMVVRPGNKMKISWVPKVGAKVVGQNPNGTQVEQTAVSRPQWYDSDFAPNVLFGYLKWAMQPFDNNLEGGNQPTITVSSHVYVEFMGTQSKWST